MNMRIFLLLACMPMVVLGFGQVMGPSKHECVGWSMGSDLQDVQTGGGRIYDDSYFVYYAPFKANGFPQAVLLDGEIPCADSYQNTAHGTDDEDIGKKYAEVFFVGGSRRDPAINFEDGTYDDEYDDFYKVSIGYADDVLPLAILDDANAENYENHVFETYTGVEVTSVLVWANDDFFINSVAKVSVFDLERNEHVIFEGTNWADDDATDDERKLCGSILRFDVPTSMRPIHVDSVKIYIADSICCYHEVDVIAITYETTTPCPETCEGLAAELLPGIPAHNICNIPSSHYNPQDPSEIIYYGVDDFDY